MKMNNLRHLAEKMAEEAEINLEDEIGYHISKGSAYITQTAIALWREVDSDDSEAFILHPVREPKKRDAIYLTLAAGDMEEITRILPRKKFVCYHRRERFIIRDFHRMLNLFRYGLYRQKET